MDGVVEIITGRERRRRWSVADKLRIVAKLQELGTLVRTVAARHGVCESLVFTWRRQVRNGALVAPEMPTFLPVQVFEPPTAIIGQHRPEQPVTPAPTPPRPQAGLIEIALGNGRQVRVGSDVNLAALRRVLAALGGYRVSVSQCPDGRTCRSGIVSSDLPPGSGDARANWPRTKAHQSQHDPHHRCLR